MEVVCSGSSVMVGGSGLTVGGGVGYWWILSVAL
jgi:hypothetical protein